MPFTFTARTVRDFEDVSLNFEQLEELFSGGSGQQAAVLQLGSLQKRTVAFGTATLTWPGASQYSNLLNFDTGLGTTVLGAGFAPNSFGLGSYDVFIAVNPPTTGHLSVQGVTTGTTGNPALGATANFLWIAIG